MKNQQILEDLVPNDIRITLLAAENHHIHALRYDDRPIIACRWRERGASTKAAMTLIQKGYIKKYRYFMLTELGRAYLEEIRGHHA